jgi:hypothetical protein
MAKATILTVKKALAAVFPDIEFTYGLDLRRGYHGHRISWVGGPHANGVQLAAGAPAFHYRGCTTYHFVREFTPEEQEKRDRKWDEEQRARVAAEPARRAAAKAAGIEKRKATAAATKATAAATKARRDTLAAAFPGVEFCLSSTPRWNDPAVSWVDGPSIEEVTTLLSIETYACQRRLTPEFKAAEALRKAAKIHTDRLAKRLAASKVRAVRVAKGIERRLTAGLAHLPRLSRPSPQMVLPMDFPVWEKPTVWVSFGVSGRA